MDDRIHILMVAYPFPPYVWVGGASIRLVKFLKYITRLRPQWQIDVVTAGYGPGEAGLPARAADLLDQVPESVRVIRVTDPAFAPPTISAKAMDFSRRALGKLIRPLSSSLADRIRPSDAPQAEVIPDAQASWNDAVLAWLDSADAGRYNLVYASSPPYSTAVLGERIKRKLGLPLVVDIKDNWLTGRQSRDEDRRAVEDEMERAVIDSADRVLCVTAATLDQYADHYGDRDKFRLITNGVDLEDFADLAAGPSADRKFRITYAGSLGGENRSPVRFFRAFARLLADADVQAEACEAFFPEHMKPSFWQAVTELGLTDRVKPAPVLPGDEYVARLAGSEVLLSINYYNETSLVPGKLYEYWAARRPIFLIEKAGAATELVRVNNLGLTADPDDEEAIYRALRTFYDGYAAGGNPSPAVGELGRFSREALAGQLAAEFEQLIGASRPTAVAAG